MKLFLLRFSPQSMKGILLLLLVSVFSCQPATEKTQEKEEKPIVMDRAKMFIMDLINQFPGSLETAVLINAVGEEVEYSYAENGSVKPEGDFAKAVNLGASITRFFFCNLSENKGGLQAENQNIQALAESLKIGFAYQSEDIMASEEMIQLQKAAFSHEMMIYTLQNQDRELTSIGVVLGDWLESFFWLTKNYQTTQNQVLKEKIGEQKILLPTLVTLLEQYRDKPEVKSTLDKLYKLNKEYESVSFEKVYKSPKLEEVEDGQLIFTDNSQTIVSFSKDNTDAIISLVSILRENIVKVD